MQHHRINQKDIRTIAKKLVEDCKALQSLWATTIALQGDLGAGKTTLTREVAQILGVRGGVTSPTFVIEKIYGLPKFANSRFDRLVHVDAYRLDDSSELDALGWHTIVNDPKNLIFVEWPERVRAALPENTIWVTLSHVDENTRDIHW